MKTTRTILSSGALTVAGCALFVALSTRGGGFDATRGAAAFADEGGAGISDVMVVAHSGQSSLLTQLKETMKAGPATAKAWKEVKARGAVLVSFAEILGKQTPSKGSASSWKENVANYAGHAKSLAAAAAEEDLSASKTAVGALGRTCSGCHRAHKGR